MTHTKHRTRLVTIIVLAALVVAVSTALFQRGASTRPGGIVIANDDPDVHFALQTLYQDGAMFYEGVGGSIDGVRNPRLSASAGDLIEILLIISDGLEHDIAVPELKGQSRRIAAVGAEDRMVFRAGQTGVFAYYCTVPGHRLLGMEGSIDIHSD